MGAGSRDRGEGPDGRLELLGPPADQQLSKFPAGQEHPLDEWHLYGYPRNPERCRPPGGSPPWAATVCVALGLAETYGPARRVEYGFVAVPPDPWLRT